ncbi:hypothetical protein [Helicobacter equorum]|uniref:Uncharacterized protein n=1 Tax=Helicobacter equorum TaxID=361872 RepID=A0A3D8IN67_9HELI|nr:hypothetical protein [Helicobacter equorum]RDU66450.1 hypothetical protein CQA54_07050 [Helicobacter equorum]
MTIKSPEAIRFYKIALKIDSFIKKRKTSLTKVVEIREKLNGLYEYCDNELILILEEGSNDEHNKQ